LQRNLLTLKQRRTKNSRLMTQEVKRMSEEKEPGQGNTMG